MKTSTTIQYIISAFLGVITLICVFTPSYLFFRQFTQYTMFIMVGFLALGIVFFVMNSERLMMHTLLYCGILCLYLKTTSNNKLRLPPETENPSIRITHVSLGNAENDYASVIDYLKALDVDFLSIQELTPDWNTQLTDKLASRFQFIETVTRMDQYGMGFFSRFPIEDLDTLYYKDVPVLAASVRLRNNAQCHIINCQLMPPVNQAAFSAISDHFRFVTTYLKSLPGEVVVLGDFHLPPWSSEVQEFKSVNHLQDGRRDIHTRNLDGSISLPRIPVEHILFTEGLDCTSFAEVGNQVVGRLGITGTYQLQHEEMAN